MNTGAILMIVTRVEAHIPSAPPVTASEGFESFDADDREFLDVFLCDAEVVADSRFAAHLAELGARPRVAIDRRFPGGGGEGRILVTSASRPVRSEVFAVLRKLRTESNWASLAAVRNLLHRKARNRGTMEAEALIEWLKEVKRWIRDANDGASLVAFRIDDEPQGRAYDTTGKVLNLVQNASEFHNERELRRDLRSFPSPLVDPVVDDGLRQIAEITLALAVVAGTVLEEPRLRRR